jgi:predicted transcriptional regulator
MSTNVSIEIDQDTANVLQMRAAELGITVPQLVAELATLDAEPRDAEPEEIAELDRRAARAAAGARVPHDRVTTGSSPRWTPSRAACWTN